MGGVISRLVTVNHQLVVIQSSVARVFPLPRLIAYSQTPVRQRREPAVLSRSTRQSTTLTTPTRSRGFITNRAMARQVLLLGRTAWAISSAHQGIHASGDLGPIHHGKRVLTIG